MEAGFNFTSGAPAAWPGAKYVPGECLYCGEPADLRDSDDVTFIQSQEGLPDGSPGMVKEVHRACLYHPTMLADNREAIGRRGEVEKLIWECMPLTRRGLDVPVGARRDVSR